MKIQFNCNSGANIHSNNNSGWLDTADIGYTDEEWRALSEDDKYEEAKDWAWNHGLEIYYEEKE